LDSDFNGLFSTFPLVEIQRTLSIPAQIAYAFDVLAVDVDAIFRMMAKIR